MCVTAGETASQCGPQGCVEEPGPPMTPHFLFSNIRYTSEKEHLHSDQANGLAVSTVPLELYPSVGHFSGFISPVMGLPLANGT